MHLSCMQSPHTLSLWLKHSLRRVDCGSDSVMKTYDFFHGVLAQSTLRADCLWWKTKQNRLIRRAFVYTPQAFAWRRHVLKHKSSRRASRAGVGSFYNVEITGIAFFPRDIQKDVVKWGNMRGILLNSFCALRLSRNKLFCDTQNWHKVVKSANFAILSSSPDAHTATGLVSSTASQSAKRSMR